jgi:hypothetical protein
MRKKNLTKLPARKVIRRLFPKPVVKAVEKSMNQGISRASQGESK